MKKGLEEAKFHAQELARIQRQKLASGITPVFDTGPHNESITKRLDKMKKVLQLERRREIAKHPERKIVNMGDRHCQPLRCVETGEEYKSMSALSRKIGIAVSTIHVQMAKNKSIKGYHYIRISKNRQLPTP